MILSSIPTFVYICSGCPRWNQGHKGPFPPWLQPISPIYRDTSYNCPTQPLVGWPGRPSSQPSEQLSTSNLLPAMLCHWPVPLKTPPLLSIVYKRTLNLDWDEMVLRNTNLPSIQLLAFWLKPSFLAPKLISWFICLSFSKKNELGLSNIHIYVTYIYIHIYIYICFVCMYIYIYTHIHIHTHAQRK